MPPGANRSSRRGGSSWRASTPAASYARTSRWSSARRGASARRFCPTAVTTSKRSQRAAAHGSAPFHVCSLRLPCRMRWPPPHPRRRTATYAAPDLQDDVAPAACPATGQLPAAEVAAVAAAPAEDAPQPRLAGRTAQNISHLAAFDQEALPLTQRRDPAAPAPASMTPSGARSSMLCQNRTTSRPARMLWLVPEAGRCQRLSSMAQLRPWPAWVLPAPSQSASGLCDPDAGGYGASALGALCRHLFTRACPWCHTVLPFLEAWPREPSPTVRLCWLREVCQHEQSWSMLVTLSVPTRQATGSRLTQKLCERLSRPSTAKCLL